MPAGISQDTKKGCQYDMLILKLAAFFVSLKNLLR